MNSNTYIYFFAALQVFVVYLFARENLKQKIQESISGIEIVKYYILSVIFIFSKEIFYVISGLVLYFLEHNLSVNINKKYYGVSIQ